MSGRDIRAYVDNVNGWSVHLRTIQGYPRVRGQCERMERAFTDNTGISARTWTMCQIDARAEIIE